MTLMQKAKEAIQEVFGDTSVSPTQTASRLRGLIEEIEEMIDSMGPLDETDVEDEEDE